MEQMHCEKRPAHLKMQSTVVFKVVLIAVILLLLFGVDASSKKTGRGKKEGKSKPRKISQRRSGQMWLSVDPAKINLIDSTPNTSRSLLYMSPWSYNVSYDKSRIPSHIFEAQCEKKGCLTADGHEDSGLESKPILYQILVLKRVKGNKKYSLQLEQRTVSVGCTCVLPYVISQK